MNAYYLKKEMRIRMKEKRSEITSEERAHLSSLILKNIISLLEYKNSEIVLTYVSKSDEVDTIAFIEQALKDGKKVAVPRCIDGTPLMDFYYIKGIDELERGSYGLLEPRQIEENKYTQHEGFCLVPGLAFDRFGSRLGYGKGYYDRFLQKFKGVTAGLCFSPILSQNKIPTGRYDFPVSYVITDRKIIKCNNPIDG